MKEFLKYFWWHYTIIGILMVVCMIGMFYQKPKNTIPVKVITTTTVSIPSTDPNSPCSNIVGWKSETNIIEMEIKK